MHLTSYESRSFSQLKLNVNQTIMTQNTEEESPCSDFNADKFVNNLLKNGANVSCDQTNAFFNESLALPPDFDEAKFKRGQRFYNDHVFGMMIAKLLGLITILSVPSILHVLSSTNLSSTPRDAFKRYMATIFHMNTWYHDNFSPGSNLWRSLENVRKRHNTTSKFRKRRGAAFISQLDMALTQFGFMGFAVTHPHEVGIYSKDTESLESWIYLWRVIGQMLGIQPEFNICRESVCETKAICDKMIENMFKPNIENQDPDFLRMSLALIDGLTVMQPTLRPVWLMLKIFRLVCPDSEELRESETSLSEEDKRFVQYVDALIRSCRHRLMRWLLNFLIRLSVWLMYYFPFLAIFRFGWTDGYVRILDRIPRTLERG